ncbi:MAG: hypothetical protein HC888_11740 [Candidatus Competibacteraceae bacterium]|nr:hypothetical protein [Candidatus Competibacteraceae bacterium]
MCASSSLTGGKHCILGWIKGLVASAALSVAFGQSVLAAGEVVASIEVGAAPRVTVVDDGPTYTILIDDERVFRDSSPSVQVIGVHILDRDLLLVLRTLNGTRRTPVTYRMILLTKRQAIASSLLGTDFLEPFGTSQYELSIVHNEGGPTVCMFVPGAQRHPKDRLCFSEGRFEHTGDH